MTEGVRRTRVPGVGVRYGITSARGDRLALVLHDDGTSEIYVLTARPHDEPRAVVRLEEGEARRLGTLLDRTHDLPSVVEDVAILIGDLAIALVPVPDDSPAIGRTLAECDFAARTGITVVAILREPDPVPGPQPGDVVRRGDTLVGVGRLEQHPAFRKLLEDGAFPAASPTQSGEG